MKVLTVVGARPQFIKEAPVGREIRKRHTQILVHTGQHYDQSMSDVFFEELEIPKPDYHLGVGSGSHGAQTGEMLRKVEEVLQAESPDWVLVYGDTNSTLAGALAAAKLHIPVAHVEAGLRSFDRRMPEEVNRVLTDHASDILFASTQDAVRHLRDEGITRGVHLVGDVMMEALQYAAQVGAEKSEILRKVGVSPKEYILATVHRPATTDDPQKLRAVMSAFADIGERIVFPIHPRTENKMRSMGVTPPENVIPVQPAGYIDFVMLQKNAKRILTDSGGVQKEAYLLGIPCVTLRDSTEWTETVEDGWNVLVGTDRDRIIEYGRNFSPSTSRSDRYGKGDASQQIVRNLEAGVN